MDGPQGCEARGLAMPQAGQQAEANVVHLVPYDGIGGVETAARSMHRARIAGVDFHVRYIFPADSRGTPALGTRLLWFVRRTVELLVRPPDVLIVSLWRSCIVGVPVKLLRPSTRLVLMLHYPWDVHVVDGFLTRRAAALADEIWADSRQTVQQRRCGAPGTPRRVISFVAQRLEASHAAGLAPNFIYWGRISPQKGLRQALEIFGEIRRLQPAATYRIIGPDGGALVDLQEDVRRRGLADAVSIAGPMDMQAIVQEARHASFYLQCSVQEGMAMSVVEAMQLGLVPVVTPVGEIGSYCTDGKNALFVGDPGGTALRIKRLLSDPLQYEVMRESAIQTWRKRPIYAESMLQAVMEMLHQES